MKQIIVKKLSLILAAGLMSLTTQAQNTINFWASGIYNGPNSVFAGATWIQNATVYTNFYSVDPATLTGTVNETVTTGSTTISLTPFDTTQIFYDESIVAGTCYSRILIRAGTAPNDSSFCIDLESSSRILGTVDGNQTMTYGNLTTLFDDYNSGSYALNLGQTLIYSPNVNDQGNLPLSVGVQPTPEPSTMALAGLGGLSLLLFRRRK